LLCTKNKSFCKFCVFNIKIFQGISGHQGGSGSRGVTGQKVREYFIVFTSSVVSLYDIRIISLF